MELTAASITAPSTRNLHAITSPIQSPNVGQSVAMGDLQETRPIQATAMTAILLVAMAVLRSARSRQVISVWVLPPAAGSYAATGS